MSFDAVRDGESAPGSESSSERGAIMSEPSRAQAARDERLSAALRENLRRRRAQARTRERAEQPDHPADGTPEDGKDDT